MWTEKMEITMNTTYLMIILSRPACPSGSERQSFHSRRQPQASPATARNPHHKPNSSSPNLHGTRSPGLVKAFELQV